MNVVVSHEAELDVINAIASCDSISRQDTRGGVDGGVFFSHAKARSRERGRGAIALSRLTSDITDLKIG